MLLRILAAIRCPSMAGASCKETQVHGPVASQPSDAGRMLNFMSVMEPLQTRDLCPRELFASWCDREALGAVTA